MLTTPTKQKHAIFGNVLSSRGVLESVMSTLGVTFAPGLFEFIKGTAPPTIAYFKTLPTACHRRWAVYLLVLEKQGCRPKIYVGSGTEARSGVSIRLDNYDKDVLVAAHVVKAFEDGYKITHKGLLCWADIPTAAMVPVARVLFVAMEAAFTFTF